MSTDPRVILGNNLKKHRRKMRLSQEALAELCDLHRTYIGSVERGERNVSLLNIVAIAASLKIPSAKLLEGIE